MNHAALSPVHQLTIDAVSRYHQDRALDDIEYWPALLNVKSRFKELVGRLINADPDYIAITTNTSMGLNWLAQGLSWKPGDRILLNNFEFPSNVMPFLNLKHQGVEIDYVQHREGRIDVADIAARITPKTRMISVSFVEFLNGFRNDLAAIGELCRKHDLLFVVDGIQGLGAMQLDARELGIDFLACGGQKWLMWPLGTAFFYTSPRIFDRVRPMATGWLSVEKAWDFFNYELDLLPTAERFEPGMINAPGLVGAIASLEMFLDVGMETIEKRITDNVDFLYGRLQESGYRLFTPAEKHQRAGIVTFYHQKAEDLHAHLTERKIQVSLRDGMVRVAPHFYNTTAEIETFCEAVAAFDRRHQRRPVWSQNLKETATQV
ncbi:MAG: aminotransferase class V-fold PLP-dependent enzyme [Calditrichaeota bacterium]|nr:aminotransferase class V-fold PLP-dependent enzyme [Calditrichota bacterium]